MRHFNFAGDTTSELGLDSRVLQRVNGGYCATSASDSEQSLTAAIGLAKSRRMTDSRPQSKASRFGTWFLETETFARKTLRQLHALLG